MRGSPVRSTTCCTRSCLIKGVAFLGVPANEIVRRRQDRYRSAFMVGTAIYLVNAKPRLRYAQKEYITAILLSRKGVERGGNCGRKEQHVYQV